MSDDAGHGLIVDMILELSRYPEANKESIKLLMNGLLLSDMSTKSTEGAAAPTKTPELISPPSKESKSS
jgi:hypothetical protein